MLDLRVWFMNKFIRAGLSVFERDNYTKTATQLLANNKDAKEFTAKGEVLSFGARDSSSISKCFCTVYVANQQLVILLGDGTEVRKFDIGKIQILRPRSDEFRFKESASPDSYIKIDDMSDVEIKLYEIDTQVQKIKAMQLFSALIKNGAKEVEVF